MIVYALFADQSTARLLMDSFHLMDDIEPVRVSCVDTEDKDIAVSARNGCIATHRILEDNEIIDKTERFHVSCNFDSEDTNLHNIQGASAGLAIGLKYASWVLEEKTGYKSDLKIAATGIVSDSTRDAKLRSVEGINPKLDAALAELGQDSVIFYPAENEAEIEKDQFDKAQARGVLLCPVGELRQAVEQLLALGPPRGARPRRSRLYAVLPVVLVLVLTIVAVGYYTEPGLEPTIDMDIEMQYGGVEQSLVDNPQVLHLSDQSASTRNIPADTQLLRFFVESSVHCALYLFLIDSKEDLYLLPDPDRLGPINLSKSVKQVVPPMGAKERWVELDEEEGVEQFYFVAFGARNDTIEALYRAYLNARKAGDSYEAELQKNKMEAFFKMIQGGKLEGAGFHQLSLLRQNSSN